MENRIVSLIHPSRGRPAKSYGNSLRWLHSAGCDVQLILSIDLDDPFYEKYIYEYRELIRQENALEDDTLFAIISGHNKSVVDATNAAAGSVADGDILVYLSDDFAAPENWGQLIIKEFEGVTEPRLIKVDDCLQPFHVKVLTIPIMNRALYEKLGYFWHPDYKSMFVDEDLYHTAQKLGALKMCPHLKFPHEHVSVGKAENDETYRRSAANWEQGKAVFAKRKAAGFPI